MFYNTGKAFHNTRKSGGSFTAAVGNAARSSLGETTGFNASKRAVEDYQATRDLGQSHFDAAAIAAAKNAPLAGTIWEAGEAIDGERCGGADHGEQMSPQERAQATANAVVEAVGVMFGIRTRMTGPKGGPVRPTPKGNRPLDASGASKCTKSQLDKYHRQLADHGKGSLEKTRRKLEKRLKEHQDNLQKYKDEGGYTSSVEKEIRNFEGELEAIDTVLGGIE